MTNSCLLKPGTDFPSLNSGKFYKKYILFLVMLKKNIFSKKFGCEVKKMKHLVSEFFLIFHFVVAMESSKWNNYLTNYL